MKVKTLLRHASALCITLGVVLSQTLIATAHANYVRSSPDADAVLSTAPHTVQIWFSEQVDPTGSIVGVHDTSGNSVDAGDSHVAPDDPRSLIVTLRALDKGTYTVVWQTLSAVDGHQAIGSFPFSVGQARNTGNYTALIKVLDRHANALQPPPLLDTLVRWLTLIALIFVAGGFAYAPFAMAAPALALLRANVADRRRRVLWIGLALLVVALAAGIGLRVAEDGLASALSGRFGLVVAGRVALVTVFSLLLWRHAGDTKWVAVLSALLLFSQSLLSHSAAEVDWLLPTLADWLHLSAASIWLGGVAMLAAVIAPHAIADRSRMKDLGLAIVRFSPFAVASVLVIYVTGIAQSIWLLGSLDALINTAYGRILSLKILLAIVMVGFGAFHQFFIAPRLQPREAEVEDRVSCSGQRFRASIIAEVVVSLILLAAAGGLTSLPPGRDLAPVPGTRVTLQTQPADDLTAMFALTPSTVGFNQFAVRLSTADGAPPVGVEEVLLRLTDVTMDMGESEVALQPYAAAGAAYYTGQSGVISMDGKWKIDLIVRRTGKPDAHATFNLQVSF